MFSLRKWYADVITADGSAVIGYWTRLRWGALRIAQASYVISRGDGTTCHRESLRVGEGPCDSGEEVQWSCKAIALTGRWRRRASSQALCLLDGPDGKVAWKCLMPAADVALTIDGEVFSGLGYVERLSMTLPPWRLPFAELRWGRAVAAGRQIVWIDWKGGGERRWVIADGRLVSASRLDEDGLVLDDGQRLVLSAPRTIRDGTIGDLLAGVPGLRWLVPRRVGEARERKWLSRATWSDGTMGWSIHEVVQWA